ncbi:hypothetical protein [Nocardia terpenica]|uniref:hypothetical protein n=1 Tax=Nocardia terpenica TaxID=455432 RepID=UPI0012E9019C|nr:hypothetical protein [Nocardia terpenica]NQE86598.1 hypothetical protein [Nocardia terpenica]
MAAFKSSDPDARYLTFPVVCYWEVPCDRRYFARRAAQKDAERVRAAEHAAELELYGIQPPVDLDSDAPRPSTAEVIADWGVRVYPIEQPQHENGAIETSGSTELTVGQKVRVVREFDRPHRLTGHRGVVWVGIVTVDDGITFGLNLGDRHIQIEWRPRKDLVKTQTITGVDASEPPSRTHF